MANEITPLEPDFPAKELIHRSIEDKMRSAYLDYAMSVIVSRALPDVRDGLKPVHRRILYAMMLAGNVYSKPHKKSARIVGDVLGKFHPHSQDAVYDAIVRMAQTFSLRYLLIDGQGNFGSIDGDDAAAMRYTEIRMTKLAHELLANIEKDTVDMMDNYDGSEQEPTVFPPTFPNLLVNGSSGIAVGMATNIPPHNLNETVTGCELLLDDPTASDNQLFSIIKAPDFPTAGIIHGLAGVREAYTTGNGRVVMRAKSEIVYDYGKGKTKRTAILVTELPYTVNKAHLIEHIADLVSDKKLDGISDLRDESDRNGMSIVIELKRDAQPFVVQNNLFKLTEMQKNFPVNMVALVHGVPRTLTLRDMILHFLDHRREVVYRCTLYELERAREKAHNLEGLAVALSNIEEVIDIIKKSPSPVDAKLELMSREWHCKTVLEMLDKLKNPELARPLRQLGVWGLKPSQGGSKRPYQLSEHQTQSILDMRLARLTALEREKIVAEYESTVATIVDLLDVLDKPERIKNIINEELTYIKETFGDKRRTVIDKIGGDIDNEDLIEKQEMVVIRSHQGYVKSMPLSEYRKQKRGGMGVISSSLKDGDFLSDMHVANSHDTMLFFTSRGRVYWLKVYQLPSFSRISRGRPIVNLLPLMDNESILEVLSVDDLHQEDKYVVMATRNGIIKRTPLTAFANPRSIGIIAINIDDGDHLIDAGLTESDQSVMLFTDGGMAVRFKTNKLRPTGRNARGVKGIKLKAGHKVVSMVLPTHDSQFVLTVTEKGLGKRTLVSGYGVKGRGIQGVVNINRNANTGKVVSCILAEEKDEVMLITDKGRAIRTSIKSVRKSSRATKGVKIFRLKSEKLVAISRISEKKLEEETGLLNLQAKKTD